MAWWAIPGAVQIAQNLLELELTQQFENIVLCKKYVGAYFLNTIALIDVLSENFLVRTIFFSSLSSSPSSYTELNLR